MTEEAKKPESSIEAMAPGTAKLFMSMGQVQRVVDLSNYLGEKIRAYQDDKHEGTNMDLDLALSILMLEREEYMKHAFAISARDAKTVWDRNRAIITQLMKLGYIKLQLPDDLKPGHKFTIPEEGNA